MGAQGCLKPFLLAFCQAQLMSVNPVLAEDFFNGTLFPVPYPGEHFILKRDSIKFKCKFAQGGKLTAKGVFFLSSERIVFVATSNSCRVDFRSFEIPLRSLKREKFEQPIFGANYLAGEVGPSNDLGSAPLGGAPAKFSLTFYSGGCQTFLHLFFQMMAEVRQLEAAYATSNAVPSFDHQACVSMAYVDPSDPSVLYLAQPVPKPGTEQKTAFSN